MKPVSLARVTHGLYIDHCLKQPPCSVRNEHPINERQRKTSLTGAPGIPTVEVRCPINCRCVTRSNKLHFPMGRNLPAIQEGVPVLYVTPLRRVRIENLTVSQMVKKSTPLRNPKVYTSARLKLWQRCCKAFCIATPCRSVSESGRFERL
jgi:hypothetical protein